MIEIKHKKSGRVLRTVRALTLRGALLRGARLRGAVLTRADLNGATLDKADLHGAELSGADLRHTSLCGALLTNANLSGADLRGADLRGAKLQISTLIDAARQTPAGLAGMQRRWADSELRGAVYNARTRWPADFDPLRCGAVLLGAATDRPLGG